MIERCHVCDREAATTADWEHGDGCECARCLSLCWDPTFDIENRNFCSFPPHDWRAEALHYRTPSATLSGWTEEPWAVGYAPDPLRDVDMPVADYQRAVVCVNACAGIVNPAALREAVELVHAIANDVNGYTRTCARDIIAKLERTEGT